MAPSDDDNDRRIQELEELHTFLERRVNRSARVYEHAITSLWLGNAGSALATLGFIGATWKNGTFDKSLLWPLGIFLAGILVMAIGAIVTLISARNRINRMAGVPSILDLMAADIKSPAEEIGLTFSNWRTVMAVLSFVLLITGVVVGFVQLLCSP